MKKITTTLLTLIIGLSISTQSFADGRDKSKQNVKHNSLQVLVQDFTVNFSFRLFKKSDYRIVLFSEDGKFMKILDEGQHRANYSYKLDKENLPEGEYICMIESEKYIATEFFKIEESIPNQTQVNFDKENQYININGEKQDYIIHIFSEDGIFLKTIKVQGETTLGKIYINTSGWESGDYFIHIESGNEIISETVKI